MIRHSSAEAFHDDDRRAMALRQRERIAAGVKERPILFSGPMVRAILDGRKTVTRRVVKPQPHQSEYEPELLHYQATYGRRKVICGKVIPKGTPYSATTTVEEFAARCPFGQPGDRLWVRETWSADFANHYPNQRVWYRADDDRHIDIEVRDGVRGIFSPESNVFVPFRWHPSIHMPRWASRITLEVTGVRVERLNNISEADAAAEGVDFGNTTDPLTGEIDCDASEAFEALWESINGPGSWDANAEITGRQKRSF